VSVTFAKPGVYICRKEENWKFSAFEIRCIRKEQARRYNKDPKATIQSKEEEPK